MVSAEILIVITDRALGVFRDRYYRVFERDWQDGIMVL